MEIEKPVYILTCEEIKELMGEESSLYFNLLNQFVLCEISKSEFVDEMNTLSKSYPNIIQLNNKLLHSLISQTSTQMMMIPPPVEDFDQQDDDTYLF